MASRNNSKAIKTLVVNAINKLRSIQGCTPTEISDYLSQEYNIPSNNIKKQVRLALARGVSYGILQRNARNTYILNEKFLEEQNQLRKHNEIVKPCPWMRKRRYRRRSKSRRRRRRRRRRKRQQRRRRRRRRRRRKSHSNQNDMCGVRRRRRRRRRRRSKCEEMGKKRSRRSSRGRKRSIQRKEVTIG